MGTAKKSAKKKAKKKVIAKGLSETEAQQILANLSPKLKQRLRKFW